MAFTTSPANRQLLALAFGQNQAAIRFLEGLGQNITIISQSGTNLEQQVEGVVSVPVAQGAFAQSRQFEESVSSVYRGENAMRARIQMEVATFVAQIPGHYTRNP